jgi:hypothetical protein
MGPVWGGQSAKTDGIILSYHVIEMVNESASSCGHTYEGAYKYQVLAKMRDIFWNETNKFLEVKIDED